MLALTLALVLAWWLLPAWVCVLQSRECTEQSGTDALHLALCHSPPSERDTHRNSGEREREKKKYYASERNKEAMNQRWLKQELTLDHHIICNTVGGGGGFQGGLVGRVPTNVQTQLIEVTAHSPDSSSRM